MNWIQDTLDYWMKVQRGWMYLEPIFASDDIKKDLPTEKMKFDTIDASWMSIMQKLSHEPNIWKNMQIFGEKETVLPKILFPIGWGTLEILADTKDP